MIGTRDVRVRHDQTEQSNRGRPSGVRHLRQVDQISPFAIIQCALHTGAREKLMAASGLPGDFYAELFEHAQSGFETATQIARAVVRTNLRVVNRNAIE